MLDTSCKIVEFFILPNRTITIGRVLSSRVEFPLLLSPKTIDSLKKAIILSHNYFSELGNNRFLYIETDSHSG